MDFRIADTFTDSLARLTNDEQRAVKTTAFDLQTNLAGSGVGFHKLTKAKDKHFWSVRVSADIRIIVHKTASNLLLCYVDHHDKAYAWAERRRLETHPVTGAAQLVEIRETVKEVVVPVYVRKEQPAPPKAPLFADKADAELLGYGVPKGWLAAVRQANEDSLFELIPHLPGESMEALLELAVGGKPRMAQPAKPVGDPFDHPDAQRRFRVMASSAELESALDFAWEKWRVFLHPEQRRLVEQDYSGPSRVSGSAGTGKTIVALHRAVHLAKIHPEARVLLATFSETLAHALRTNLRRLIGTEPIIGERIDVHSLGSLGLRLHRTHCGPVKLATRDEVKEILRAAASAVPGHKFTPYFLLIEWEQVVDARQLASWEAYRDVVRLGRKTRLPEAQRKVLWSIFERVRTDLKTRGLMTQASMFTALASALAGKPNAPFDFAVIDEAQDIGIPELRFFASLCGNRPNALFFAGDLGQRIFQQPFSWKALGVDVRGRSRTLRVNYRTSQQIRQHADRLLGPEVVDVDGIRDDRSDTISVFSGPPPDVRVFPDQAKEIAGIASWLTEQSKAGVLSHEIAVFVRSPAQLDRARKCAETAHLPFKVLDDRVETASGHVSICTMHLAKGLEFRAVAVMACDDEVIPLQERIETVGDDADLGEVYETERNLLYVACTRAREHLLVTGVEPASEFLDDLLKPRGGKAED